MFGHKHKKIHKYIQLSTEQAEGIRVALAQPESQVDRDAPDRATTGRTPSRHLTDMEFLILCTANDISLNDISLNDISLNDISLNDISLNDISLNDTSSDQMEQEMRAHLAQCPVCSAELERLQQLGASWQDPTTRARLRARRDAAGKPLTSARPRISLAALIPAQALYAAQAIPDPETVTFPVYEAGEAVAGLSATLRRRNHEYYALIVPLDAEVASHYGDRSAVLTIADAESQHPILQREIAVGVAVLLGTHLPLAITSYVQADLKPVSL